MTSEDTFNTILAKNPAIAIAHSDGKKIQMTTNNLKKLVDFACEAGQDSERNSRSVITG